MPSAEMSCIVSEWGSLKNPDMEGVTSVFSMSVCESY